VSGAPRPGRRRLLGLLGGAAGLALAGRPAAAAPAPRRLACGLAFPEGPVALADGSLLVCEIARGALTRITPEGRTAVLARPGGGPNGAAIGPDGACYLCNNGGLRFVRQGGRLLPAGQAPDYTGGRIERVDLASGRVDVLYERAGEHRLSSPNDLVFDAAGGFWFTDTGSQRARERDHGGLYYARADGSAIQECVYPLATPNGVGLSPDGGRLYVAELEPARLLAFELSGPGRLAPQGPLPGRIAGRAPGRVLLDSLAVEAQGAVAVAAPFAGAVLRFDPDNGAVATVPVPGEVPTNLCFGGADRRTAYITLGASGQLVAMDWPEPGLAPAYGA